MSAASLSGRGPLVPLPFRRRPLPTSQGGTGSRSVSSQAFRPARSGGQERAVAAVSPEFQQIIWPRQRRWEPLRSTRALLPSTVNRPPRMNARFDPILMAWRRAAGSARAIRATDRVKMAGWESAASASHVPPLRRSCPNESDSISPTAWPAARFNSWSPDPVEHRNDTWQRLQLLLSATS